MFSILFYLSALVFLISVCCLGILVWAKYWAVVRCTVIENEAVKVSLNGRATFFPKAKYRYSFEGREYIGERVYLFGGRAFETREEVVEFNKFLNCYVCPLFPKVSYLRQDKRLFFGLVFVVLVCVVNGVFIRFYV